MAVSYLLQQFNQDVYFEINKDIDNIECPPMECYSLPSQTQRLLGKALGWGL